MKKGLYALALGTFGFGIAEYVMMSILPDVAAGFGISISQAGNLISSYALGVCAGAPLMVLIAQRWPLRRILVMLMWVFIAGNIVMATSPTYLMAICGRFISGIPHGAFFGVGAIVANRLAVGGKVTSAVAVMVMGMTVANLLGVPLGNWIGQSVSWRLVFAFSAVWGLLTIWAIRTWIPILKPLTSKGTKGLFAFLKKPQPWLLIVATILGNGGIFCWYSYINPVMSEVSGFGQATMPLLMLLAGGSMCLGNYLGGNLSDRYAPRIVAMYTQCITLVTLILIFFLAQYPVASVILMCVGTGCLFAVSSPQQQLLLQYSPGGQMMGGAMVQLAFNLGNAIGAYFGGVTIGSGLGAEYTAIVGAPLALLGVLVLAFFNYSYRYSKIKDRVIRSK